MLYFVLNLLLFGLFVSFFLIFSIILCICKSFSFILNWLFANLNRYSSCRCCRTHLSGRDTPVRCVSPFSEQEYFSFNVRSLRSLQDLADFELDILSCRDDQHIWGLRCARPSFISQCRTGLVPRTHMCVTTWHTYVCSSLVPSPPYTTLVSQYSVLRTSFLFNKFRSRGFKRGRSPLFPPPAGFLTPKCASGLLFRSSKWSPNRKMRSSLDLNLIFRFWLALICVFWLDFHCKFEFVVIFLIIPHKWRFSYLKCKF